MTFDPAPRRALFVVGRKENGKNSAVLAARKLLTDDGYALSFLSLKDRQPKDLPAQARRSEDGDLSLIVAAGGDGSVREAAAIAYATATPLALLPLGTANDLARTLDIPLDPDRAVDLLRSGRRRRIDLGRCNGRIFCNVASIGLSAKVAQRLTRERKKRWGPLAYAREAVDALRTFRSLPVRLTLDDRSLTQRALQVGIASGESQGGGARVTPDAQIDDGRLRVYALEPQKPLRLMMMALLLKLGAHNLFEGAHFFAAKRVRLETEKPEKINVDGDLLERTPADLELLPGAIEVLVPDLAEQGLGGLMTEDDSNGAASPLGGLVRSDAEVSLAALLEALLGAAETHARGAERLQDSAPAEALQANADRRRSDVDALLAAGMRDEDTTVEPDPDRLAVKGVIEDVRAVLSSSTIEMTLRESRTAEEQVTKALETARSHRQSDAVAAQLARLADGAQEMQARLAEAQAAAGSEG
ncbi:diacylglycerol/lipid kinase family protein [Algihabitans sp.]|uniref:diacylglycerol/lipid kinase family protein n=1 Tax=Algihabitans sp. TaxID=2821514 RepID=UPI003BA86E77